MCKKTATGFPALSNEYGGFMSIIQLYDLKKKLFSEDNVNCNKGCGVVNTNYLFDFR